MPHPALQQPSRHFVILTTATMAFSVLALLTMAAPSSSAPLQPTPLNEQMSGAADIVQVRARGAVGPRGGRAAVGPRGGRVAVGPRGRGVAVGPRGRAVAVGPRRGGWARPGWYRWPRGGAVAAGAALGFVAAASAAAFAGAAPAPGMCWYYTDPSRTRGFWDYCP